MSENFILAAPTVAMVLVGGVQVPVQTTAFYTGKSGEEFVSVDLKEAFRYTHEGAVRKANVLNKITQLDFTPVGIN